MTERNVSVTLKAGKGYDAPWVTVTGDNSDEVRRNLAQAVNLDLETADQYSLAEVTIFASEAFQSTQNVVVGLGAGPIAPEPEESPIKGSEEPAGDGWAKAKAKRAAKKDDVGGTDAPEKPVEAPQEDADPILVAIQQATSSAALRRIHGREKARWTEVHTEAAKVRQEELA